MSAPLLKDEANIYLLAQKENIKTPLKSDLEKLVSGEKEALIHIQEYIRITSFEPPKELNIIISVIKSHINFLEEFLPIISKIYKHNPDGRPKKSLQKFAITSRFLSLKCNHKIENKERRCKIIQEELVKYLSLHLEHKTIYSYVKPKALKKESETTDLIEKHIGKIQFFYTALHQQI